MRQARAPLPHRNNVVNLLDLPMGQPGRLQGCGLALTPCPGPERADRPAGDPMLTPRRDDGTSWRAVGPVCDGDADTGMDGLVFCSPAIPCHHHGPINNWLSRSGSIIDVLRQQTLVDPDVAGSKCRRQTICSPTSGSLLLRLTDRSGPPAEPWSRRLEVRVRSGQ